MHFPQKMKVYISLLVGLIFKFVSCHEKDFNELLGGFASKKFWNDAVLNHCNTKTDKYFQNQTSGKIFLLFNKFKK